MSPISILFVPFHISDETSTETDRNALFNIESLPGSNFKKGAEIEVKKMIEIDAEMRTDRDTEISVKFRVLVSLYNDNQWKNILNDNDS